MVRRTAVILDLSVSITLTTVLVIEQAVRASPESSTLVGSIALAIVIGGSLAFHRLWPLASYAVGSAALITQALWADFSAIAPYANLVGLFSLGVYGSRRRALWGPVILIPGLIAYFTGASEPFGVLTITAFGAWFAAWAVGFQMARSREQSDRAREASRHEAIAEERVRIARELHDVVGHTVNVMLVQAGASRLMIDRDPSTAKAMLGDMENTARQALDELDTLLGILHDDVEPATPMGLGELPALRDRLSAVGLELELDIVPRTLPPPVDVVAYRIVQEALTNSLRHGKASRATVRVAGTETLTIDVSDNGHSSGHYLPGRGLRGMSERVELFDGSLQHWRDAHGFHIHAELTLA
ncbi:sensor histidine kinase [Microcella sp.]|uniref:sensor histidine kinase n=1 Tax=Microcella sp. TaxID=1913979 RepID=UPI003F6E6CDE